MKMKIGKILKDRRIELGYSQSEVARMTDLTMTSISNIERDRPCTVDSLRKVCDALHLGLAFTIDDDTVHEVNGISVKINECCQCLDEMKQQLQNLIK